MQSKTLNKEGDVKMYDTPEDKAHREQLDQAFQEVLEKQARQQLVAIMVFLWLLIVILVASLAISSWNTERKVAETESRVNKFLQDVSKRGLK